MENKVQRSNRILTELRESYPGKSAFDLDGRAMHFVCEVEPTIEHPEYDRAVEVMLLTLPHKHLKMTQYYTVLAGTLELHVNDEVIILEVGDQYDIKPNIIHWAKSENEAWVELISTPGWTKEDHIRVKS
jgi:mannose-6-phosphate isomerase-like protein (cupin superfamily)